MESTPQNALSLLLISSFILAMVSPSFSCPTHCEAKINETWYLRQVATGENQNQVIIESNSTVPITGFGMIAVNNWVVLDAPEPNANVIAHVRGLVVQAGQAGASWYTSSSIVFEGPRFIESTLEVSGITGSKGQWAIVGGTGELTSAHGAIKYTLLNNSEVENYRQLDVHAFYTPTMVNENGASII